MSDTNTWQGVQDEVRRRIRARQWKPGDLIPNEADLATEFGCARTTVNRALRELAGAGLVERRRKSGTRVALHPVGKAVIEIPVIRQEIEAGGQRYGYGLLTHGTARPPARVAYALGLGDAARTLHLSAIHLADGAPYVLEDRWINLAAVPQAEHHDFSRKSANEWLLETVPVARGELAISAQPCGPDEARALDVTEGTPLLTLERSTWGLDAPVTFVRLWHMPGHRIVSPIAG
ncbi:GntR family transcriptional regulator [Nioella sediminis]|jgi:GntR family histidine utilization transcriptional repressor|uniref:GntR family transcriptional regulator n=1 Tax=Nioella sediminis TaxID=1912092 RepID=UPI0008FD3CF7|nr:GntR family transcriptional regulator [Nioella sediminis]TBX21187.1 GntR family transcriptional regulator [Roseovarius sp. JS7-11]